MSKKKKIVECQKSSNYTYKNITNMNDSMELTYRNKEWKIQQLTAKGTSSPVVPTLAPISPNSVTN